MPRISHLFFLSYTLMDLVLAVALVSLFALVYSDHFRTDPRYNGGIEGWGFGRQQRTYNDANHRDLPPMSLVWNQRYVSHGWLHM